MASYWSIDRLRGETHREDLESRFDINIDMLIEGTTTKYGVGTDENGCDYITTATIIDPTSGATVKVNAKNALLIGLEALAYRYNLKEESFIFNPDGRMRRLMAVLMPESDDINVESVFYKRLLNKTCRRDDIRNCRSGIPYRACFNYIKKNRYKVISSGNRYTEDEIVEIAEMLYSEVADPYIKSKKMTPVIREVISETVDVRLQAEYGWKFSHQQYIDMEVNEELIDRIVRAFPENQKTLNLLETILDYDSKVARETAAKTIINRPKTNPLLDNKTWRRMMARELRHPFNVISEDFLNKTISLEAPEDRQSYIREIVSEFVTKVNNERLYQTSFIRDQVDDRDRSINTEKDIDEVSSHLWITLNRIEHPEFEEYFSRDDMEATLLADMSIDASDKEKDMINSMLDAVGFDQPDESDIVIEGLDEIETKMYNKATEYILDQIRSLPNRYKGSDLAIMMQGISPKPLDVFFGHESLEKMCRIAGIRRADFARQEKGYIQICNY